MKITLVCGHYLPELGYLEVHLARALQRLGHEVVVVTSTAVPKYVQRKYTTQHTEGLSSDQGVAVYRLKPFFTLGQLVWARGIRKQLNDIQPDLVLVIGLGKAFPKPALQSEKKYRLGILLGDNHHTYLQLDWKQRLLRNLFKKPVYELGIRTANKVFTYTPETIEVVNGWIDQHSAQLLQQKQVSISLGFDHYWFYFDEELRRQTRSQLNVAADEKLIITTARMGGNKDFEPLFLAVEQWAASQPIKCLVVGLGDDVHSQNIRQRVENSSARTVFLTQNFVPRTELNALYNAADIGFWPITAISVFEGMGTGLYLMLPPAKSLNHLALDGNNGRYFGEVLHNDLKCAFDDVNRISRKERAGAAVEKFSYQSIARTVLESLQSG